MKCSIARHTAVSLTCVGWLTAGAVAFAQEAPQSQDQYTQDQYSRTSPNQSTSPSTEATTPSNSKSDHSAMKDCVARERAENSSLSQSQAKKACHDALKAQKTNPDHEPQPPH
jgi:cytoskeletal protein RodZ